LLHPQSRHGKSFNDVKGKEYILGLGGSAIDDIESSGIETKGLELLEVSIRNKTKFTSDDPLSTGIKNVILKFKRIYQKLDNFLKEIYSKLYL